MEEKSEFKDVMMSLLKELKGYIWFKCEVCLLQQAFELLCRQEDMGVYFEYTALGTLHQNWRVERKFYYLFKWLHAMLNNEKFSHF